MRCRSCEAFQPSYLRGAHAVLHTPLCEGLILLALLLTRRASALRVHLLATSLAGLLRSGLLHRAHFFFPFFLRDFPAADRAIAIACF